MDVVVGKGATSVDSGLFVGVLFRLQRFGVSGVLGAKVLRPSHVCRAIFTFNGSQYKVARTNILYNTLGQGQTRGVCVMGVFGLVARSGDSTYKGGKVVRVRSTGVGKGVCRVVSSLSDAKPSLRVHLLPCFI